MVSWGLAIGGQTGHGDNPTTQPTPSTPHALNAQLSVAALAAGRNHSLVANGACRLGRRALVTATQRRVSSLPGAGTIMGRLATGIRGSVHARGHGLTDSDQMEPRPVKSLQAHRIVTVACGSWHSVALSGESLGLRRAWV